jgi:hypothetical protein
MQSISVFGRISTKAGLAGIAIAAIAASAAANGPNRPEPQDLQGPDENPTAIGPDVIVGDLSDILRWGGDATRQSYSVGTTSCNIGTMRLDWFSNSNRKPVIGQNLYRYKVVNGSGRFEQIGQSWLKHGFFALSQSLCSPCNDSTNGSQLGVGCSDPYSASLNGEQGRLGPRSHVNASTGFYPWPFTNPGAGYMVPPAAEAVFGRRLVVRNDDLNPALNAGARYFAEAQYVTGDEPAWGNNHNNVSYRRANVTGSGTNFNIAFAAPTVRQNPAVYAWRDVIDSGVQIQEQIIRNDGSMIVANNVTTLADGRFAYEYAIFNNTSDRAAGSFSVPVCDGATITDVGFTDVSYHSGEPQNSTDWVVEIGNGRVTWRTAETFAQNPNANALRWGTMYNFRFISDRGPGTRAGQANVGLFKPGSPAQAVFSVRSPALCCPADFSGNGTLDFFDYLDYVQAYAANDLRADFNADGTLDFFDYLDFVDAFNSGC